MINWCRVRLDNVLAQHRKRCAESVQGQVMYKKWTNPKHAGLHGIVHGDGTDTSVLFYVYRILSKNSSLQIFVTR